MTYILESSISSLSDDDHSFAYDGCRCLLWHEQQPTPVARTPWKAGDVVGAWLDLDKKRFTFTLNGARDNMMMSAYVLTLGRQQSM